MQNNYSFRNRRQSFFFICFIAIALTIGAVVPVAANKTPVPGKTLIIVGGEIGYPPYSFLDKNVEPAGFQVELTRAVARTMGMDIEIRLGPWPETRKALEDGTIDIIPGMFYSEERAKIFDFSPPFSIVSVAIFARTNSPSVKSIEDLRNKEIIVMRGEAMHDYILKHRLTDRIMLTETPADALRMLASGKGDYALVAQMPGFYWIKELKLSNIISVGPSLEPFKNCFAVRKGNKLLLSRFTEGLSIINQTGEYSKLYEKWLGVLEPNRITPGLIIKYAAIVLVPLILLLAVSLLWSWMLNSKVNQKTKELQEREERYRTILNTTMDGFWTISLIDQKFTDVNDTYCRMSGYSKDELLKLKIADIDALKSPDAQAAIIQKIIAKGSGIFETRHRRKDGSVFDVELSVTYQNTNNGMLICFCRDITERKQMETHFLQSQKMEAIGTLAGGIAHDFNNILSVIIGYAELARDRNQKEDKEKYLQETLNGAKRAKNLVKQILTFSRQDDHEKKHLDIKILLKEAVKFLRASIPSTIEIDQQISAEECNIMADPTQMHQVIMNLCTNASHAMRETGGTLKIELANIELTKDDLSHHRELKPGHYVKLTVSDTGYGIDPAIVQRVFEPFFTTKSVDEGTGLGLSVVYGIAKSHGGVINVYSEQGQGAAFNVYLPRIIQSETILVDTDKPVIGGMERILFVDDEPALVDMGTRTLFSLGYYVTSATSSKEALDLFSTEPQRFDLVITDMTLPKMTGIDLSREILKIRPDIPIILCSGFNEPETEEKANTLGIKAYLTKPLTKRELAGVMREVLDGRKG